eukprot:CAMPEP_0204353706 /NCGR_PEP_ID=MMETSP0469-20131031/32868_1 /ASSEMBLY_ACC=CAM_ASM_000384 /TAXON_ID=2969 /ORGANISM="Oxyrrhis marina" /LENGTH=63 /DNA_ID=CAMNT_0051340671 /DNA_START=352 /DNA_END=540 /DNA_ORIENTATION=-
MAANHRAVPLEVSSHPMESTRACDPNNNSTTAPCSDRAANQRGLPDRSLADPGASTRALAFSS